MTDVLVPSRRVDRCPDTAEYGNGSTQTPASVRVLADVGFEADSERMVAYERTLVAIEPHPAVWGVMMTHKGLGEDSTAYWQLPLLSAKRRAGCLPTHGRPSRTGN